jgi:hypothetical protein
MLIPNKYPETPKVNDKSILSVVFFNFDYSPPSQVNDKSILSVVFFNFDYSPPSRYPNHWEQSFGP